GTSIFSEQSVRDSAEAMWRSMSPEARQEYGKEYFDGQVTKMLKYINTGDTDLSPVVNAFEDAVLSKHPMRRVSFFYSLSILSFLCPLSVPIFNYRPITKRVPSDVPVTSETPLYPMATSSKSSVSTSGVPLDELMQALTHFREKLKKLLGTFKEELGLGETAKQEGPTSNRRNVAPNETEIEQSIRKLFPITDAFAELFTWLRVTDYAGLEELIQQQYRHIEIRDLFEEIEALAAEWDDLLSRVDSMLHTSISKRRGSVSGCDDGDCLRGLLKQTFPSLDHPQNDRKLKEHLSAAGGGAPKAPPGPQGTPITPQGPRLPQGTPRSPRHPQDPPVPPVGWSPPDPSGSPKTP
ncbi:unnamed protein product, partial [Cyprideis torosa]